MNEETYEVRSEQESTYIQDKSCEIYKKKKKNREKKETLTLEKFHRRQMSNLQ